MKQYFLFVFFVVLVGQSWAQTANTKVKEVYSQAQITSMTADQIEYLNFLSEKGAVVSYAPEKSESFADILTMPTKGNVQNAAVSAENFNVLAFDIPLLEDKFQSFKIGTTGYVVTLYSQKRVDTMYEKYKKSQSSK